MDKKYHKIIGSILLVITVMILFTGCRQVMTKEEKIVSNQVMSVQNSLKDPDSMILVGDITYVQIDKDFTVAYFSINAKNSFGAYTGSVKVSVWHADGEKDAWVTEKSDYFIDISKAVESLPESIKDKNPDKWITTKIDGEKMAKYLKCKYNKCDI